jgi:4-hydroxybenzoyl-CoA thioesterase
MTFAAVRPLRFGDCDPSGIAYFPSYLNILVGVVEDFFAEVKWPWTRMDAAGIATPTVKLDLEFVKSGFHGDLLEFALAVRRVGRSSLDLSHRVSSNGALLWRAEQRLVLTSVETRKSVTWPDDLRISLEGYVQV